MPSQYRITTVIVVFSYQYLFCQQIRYRFKSKVCFDIESLSVLNISFPHKTANILNAFCLLISTYIALCVSVRVCSLYTAKAANLDQTWHMDLSWPRDMRENGCAVPSGRRGLQLVSIVDSNIVCYEYKQCF